MVAMLSTTLCKKKIIPSVLSVDMRSLRISSAKSCTQMMNFTELLTSLDINFTYLDISIFPKEITFIILEVQGRIATSDFEIDEDRI